MLNLLQQLLGMTKAGARGGSGTMTGTLPLFPMSEAQDFGDRDPRFGGPMRDPTTPGSGAMATPLGQSFMPPDTPGQPNVGLQAQMPALLAALFGLNRGRMATRPGGERPFK